jgi:sec-independent protein translocase protein TatC
MFKFLKNKRQINDQAEMSFLEHLEVLRWHLIRSAIVVFLLTIIFFVQKEWIFDSIILAPKFNDFITYKALCKLDKMLNAGGALCINNLQFQLINTDLSGQFTMHMWIAIISGIVAGIPYLFWELWRFIKPALKEKEKKLASGFVLYASILFLIGVLFGYYVIVPLSVNFLGTYQVSLSVVNMISLDSFVSTVTNITLASGIVFELPILVYILSSIGILSPSFMRKFRRHAVVVILVVAAIITPSPDITSQLLVAAPLYILYELSIYVSAYVVNKNKI